MGFIQADFIDDRITMVDDELLITLFFSDQWAGGSEPTNQHHKFCPVSGD